MKITNINDVINNIIIGEAALLSMWVDPIENVIKFIEFDRPNKVQTLYDVTDNYTPVEVSCMANILYYTYYEKHENGDIRLKMTYLDVTSKQLYTIYYIIDEDGHRLNWVLYDAISADEHVAELYY
jgi:hypothetical protein